MAVQKSDQRRKRNDASRRLCKNLVSYRLAAFLFLTIILSVGKIAQTGSIFWTHREMRSPPHPGAPPKCPAWNAPHAGFLFVDVSVFSEEVPAPALDPCDELATFGRFPPASEGAILFSMGILSDQITELFGCARRYYASARVCEDADLKRRLVLMADDYVRQAKEMQSKQERLLEDSK